MADFSAINAAGSGQQRRAAQGGQRFMQGADRQIGAAGNGACTAGAEGEMCAVRFVDEQQRTMAVCDFGGGGDVAPDACVGRR